MHCVPKDRVTKFLLEKVEKKTKNFRHSTTLILLRSVLPMFVTGWHQTEFMIIGPRQQLVKVSVESVTVGDTMIKPIISLRNLGVWFDQHMTMSDHIGRISSRAFYILYNLRQIRKCFPDEACKTLVHALVTCHLDY